MTEYRLERGDENERLEMRPGDTLSVSLEDKPTTGYQWRVLVPDPEVVALENSAYVSPQHPVGGRGMRVFRFEARASGTTTLQFSLRRSWEPKAAAHDSFEVSVRVKAD